MNSKIITIIKHEYLSRVKSKGFIIGTLIGPLLMLLVFAIPAVVAIFSENQTEKKIAIIDKTGMFGQDIVKKDPNKYFLSNDSKDDLYNKVLSEELDGYLYLDSSVLSSGKAFVYSRGGGGLGFETSLEKNISNIIRHQRLIEAGANAKVMQILDEDVEIVTNKVTEKGTTKDYTAVYSGIGYFLGFVIYILMLMYGQTVMKGVIEEKANRIIEVIASSAKPFEIMMGKVIGIGAVGLTQVSVWLVISAIGITIAGGGVSTFIEPNMTGVPNAQQGIMNGFEMPYISPWLGIAFLFYFLSGYFIYSTLFAAVGSAVDQEQDAQQLQWPITIPIILPILFIFNVMSNPDGTLAVILSLIPFFSPILMMVRVAATEVPIWQVILSVVLLIGTFFGSLWFAAKVYRVGILMYGKKTTIKDLIKWFMTK